MKQKIVICLLIIAAFFQNSTLQAQGWDKTFTSSLSDTSVGHSVVETSDSGYVFSGVCQRRNQQVSPFYPFVIKTDNIGNTIWRYEPTNIAISVWYPNGEQTQVFNTPDKGILLVGTEGDSSHNYTPIGFFIIKLDKNGQQIWKKNYAKGFTSAAMSPDNSRIVVASYNFLDSITLFHLSLNGDSLKSLVLQGSNLSSIVFGEDNHIYINSQQGSNIVAKIDSNGNKIWEKQIGFGKMRRSKDGRIILGSTIKFDYNGNILFGNSSTFFVDWSYAFAESSKNNTIASIDYRYINNPQSRYSIFFVKKDSLGNTINRRFFESFDTYNNYLELINTFDGGFVGIGRKGNLVRLTKFTDEGIVYSNLLKGMIHVDFIQNCRLDTNERGYPNRLISIEKNNDIRWAVTDSVGNYEIQLDTGNYTIKAIAPTANWRFCTPSVNKQFSNFGTTDTANFAAQALVFCPQLRISTATTGLRRCFDNNYYTIRYTNEGTQAAQNAYITLKLDSLLEYISTTRPLSSRQGQSLRFDLGTVPIGFEGQFSVQVRVKCGDSTRLGQSLCTEARIFPDTVCVPAPNWSGANIVVSGRCDRDSVRFLIQNTGSANSSLLKRKIVEDEIVFLDGLISVPANGSQTVSLPANGKTWQLLMQQEPNHPLSNHPTAVIEGCRLNQNQPISTGFVNQFPTDDGSPTIDNVCTQIAGSYDPNDKEGLPLGYKSAHFIDQNQDIDYRIRFQNTGNDTAFTVVIRDTLSDFLDIASLKIGASSHRFNWTIEGENVLVFRFDNILLPDSFRNEAASHGFVKFKISQKKNVALGTKVMNQADIYFDFNAPIRTNKTVHTIGKDFIISVLHTISPLPNVEIKVYPNPFNAEATIEIQGFEKITPLSISSNFILFDALGRQIRQEKFDGNQFVFERQNLQTGFYLFKIENSGRLVGTGKFLMR